MLSWINVCAGVLNDYVHSAIFQGLTSLNHKNMLINLRRTNSHEGVCWCDGLIVLWVIYDKEFENNLQQSGEMLARGQRQQGSKNLCCFFVVFLRKEKRRWSSDNMNEWSHCNIFLGRRESFMSSMACAWNISPCGDECVCVLSIIAGADECEVKHTLTSSVSLVGRVPLVTFLVKEHVEFIAFLQFWTTR